MKNLVTTATLILSIPDGMTDQQAFASVNRDVNPYGVDLVFPLKPTDNPAILIRVLKNDLDTKKTA